MLKKRIKQVVSAFVFSLLMVSGAMAQNQTILGIWEREKDGVQIKFEREGSANFKGTLAKLSDSQLHMGFSPGENNVNAQWDERAQKYIRNFKTRKNDGTSRWHDGTYTIINADRLQDENGGYMNRVGRARNPESFQSHPSPSLPYLVGCFKDSAYSRDMTGHTFSLGNMTTEACISACSQKGFMYAATQFGSHCFCDNKYGGQGSASNCDMRCSGDSSQICGGHSANSVYKIKESTESSKRPDASAGSSISGEWRMNANGFEGVMEISGSPDSYAGRFKLAGGTWEAMLELKIQGNTMSFLRAHAQQRYTGTIRGASISGTFTQGGAGSYSWRASQVSSTAAAGKSGSFQDSEPVARTIFNNWNKAGVTNGPTKSTQFSISSSVTVTSILNYHWNNGQGYSIGTIALKGSNGTVYGPWQASGLQSSVPSANWIVKPYITIPAGTYTVIDSHPASWSQNSGSHGAGFSSISGY
ncbi:MAG: WSC domain-containing protein [Deltaproteobacteria bacterium]|nr:WSC domain-containing protein [Deltaproteobacteria bacterium]